jgi:ABC-type Fe3+/spermidine/putrescine transport system ATPase subunit
MGQSAAGLDAAGRATGRDALPSDGAPRGDPAVSYLEVRDLVVRFGEQVALHGVSFAVEAGERLCLLGPSGCGKTTSLRVVAGFIAQDSGQVAIGGRNMDGIPPERRNIGILFQSYALFPHLSVFDNVAFGLRMRGLPEARLRRKVEEALALVRLPNAGRKRPAMLSGGEQQRIAFARAVVIEPSLLLLDEPFSNLDARLRQEMRAELLDLLHQLDVATVMVTHDQEEAMAIADRIVVMRAGRIEQVGAPTEIYENPATLFVARFVGESNLFAGEARGGGRPGIVDVAGLGALSAGGGPAAGRTGPVQLLLRPEKIRVLERHSALEPRPDRERAIGRVERVQYLGHRTEYAIRVGEQLVVAWRLNETPLAVSPGDNVVVEWAKTDSLVFPAEPA